MTLAETTALMYTGRLLPMVSYVSLTLLAFFVLSYNPGGRLNRIFAVTSLAAAAWNVALFQVLGSGNAAEALINWRWYEAAVLVLVPSWTYFALSFTGRSITPVLVYAPSAIFLPFVFFTDLVHSGTAAFGEYFLRQGGGGVQTIMELYTAFYILYGLFLMVNAYIVSGPMERQRVKWIIIGTGTVILSGTVDSVLTITGVQSLPISPAMSVFAVAAVGYSFTIGGGSSG